MPCSDVEIRLDAFIDSELTPSEQVDVARHVAACQSCEERVRGTLELRDALTNTTKKAVDDLNLARVWPAVESAMDAHDGRRWWRLLGVGRATHGVPMWAAGVAMAAGALLTMRALQPPGIDPIPPLAARRVLIIDQLAGPNIALRHDEKFDNTFIVVNHQVEALRP